MNIIQKALLSTMVASSMAFGTQAQTTKKVPAKPKAKTEVPAKVAEIKSAPATRQIPLAEKPITLGNGQKVVLDEVMSKPKNGFVLSKVITDPATDCAQLFYNYKNADSTNIAVVSAEITDEDKNGIITWAEAKNMFMHQSLDNGEVKINTSAMTPIAQAPATGKGKLIKNLGNSIKNEFGATTSHSTLTAFDQNMDDKTIRNDVVVAGEKIYNKVFIPK